MEEWVEIEEEIFDESRFKYYEEEAYETQMNDQEKNEELLKREMLGLKKDEELDDEDYEINFVSEDTVFLGKREYQEDFE